LLLSSLPGCEKVQGLLGQKAPEAAGSAEPHAKPAEAKAPKTEGEATRADEVHAAAEPEEYALPFAWEADSAEPLGRTRSFLRDVFQTNTDYMQIGTKLFPVYAEKETPRATVLTCADSRVHTTAFDASPENDDYMVRNLGNQVVTSAGSLEYGIEELNTPLLFILGHTGCDAVKAAMDGGAKLDAAVKEEIGHIHPKKKEVQKKGAKPNDRDVWVDAVVDNVHDQVEAALEQFGKRVHSGKLTIVGAVLDYRNDIGLGAGRLILVDVNGNRDQDRIAAFIEAVTGKKSAKRPPSKEEPRKDDDRASSSKKESAADLAQALATLIPPRKGSAEAEKGHGGEDDHESAEHAHGH
jgi:carbonic anhydrase